MDPLPNDDNGRSDIRPLAEMNRLGTGASDQPQLYDSGTAQPTGNDPLAITPSTRANSRSSNLQPSQRTESAHNNMEASNYLRSRQPSASVPITDQAFYTDQNIIHNASAQQNQQRQNLGNQAFARAQRSFLPDPAALTPQNGPPAPGETPPSQNTPLYDFGKSAPGDKSLVDRGDNSLLPGMGILKGKQLDALGEQLGVKRGMSSMNGQSSTMEDGVYAHLLRDKIMQSPEFQSKLANDPQYSSLTKDIADTNTARQRGMTLPDYQDATRAQAKQDAMTPEDKMLAGLTPAQRAQYMLGKGKNQNAADANTNKNAQVTKAESDKVELGNNKLTSAKEISDARIKLGYATLDEKAKADTAKALGNDKRTQAIFDRHLEQFGNDAAKARSAGKTPDEIREMAEDRYLRGESEYRKAMVTQHKDDATIDANLKTYREQWVARNPGIYAKKDATASSGGAAPAQAAEAEKNKPAGATHWRINPETGNVEYK